LKERDSLIETAVIDAMTTNETLFFRDRVPFELFRNFILPKVKQAHRYGGTLRIWCAACSSGQEPYSLSMMLDEHADELRGMKVSITATDVSQKMLRQAREGIYSQFEVQRGLPVRLLLKYFKQEGTRWRIDPGLASRIDFRHSNLIEPFRALGTFDVIFCRNVLIYLGTETKRDVLSRLAQSLSPEGYLVLGGAETVMGLTSKLAPHAEQRGLYVQSSHPEAYSVAHVRQRRVV